MRCWPALIFCATAPGSAARAGCDAPQPEENGGRQHEHDRDSEVAGEYSDRA